MDRMIVGVDGSETARAAAQWAAAEASRWGVPLHVAHVWLYPYAGTRPEQSEPHRLMGDDARQLLDEEVRAIRLTNPDLEIVDQLVEGGAVEALAALATASSVITVGIKGQGGLTRLVLGSIAASLCHHSPCPVAVIGPAAQQAHPDGPLVVGVNGGPSAVAAIAWAVEEAKRRGVGVTAVATWSYPVLEIAGVDIPLKPMGEQAADALEHLDAALWVADADRAGVEVTTDVEEGSVEVVLTQRSEWASLVIVGAGHHSSSIGTRVAGHAHCPVVVVP